MLERCTEAEFEHGDEYLARLQPNWGARHESGGSAIQAQNGRYLSILIRRARGPLVGQDGILRRVGNPPLCGVAVCR